MNRQFRRAVLLCGLLFLPFRQAHAQTAANSSVGGQSDAIVANCRKIIVLMDGATALDPGVRERSATAGRILFQQNQELLSALGNQLTAALGAGNTAPVGDFLNRLENNPDYRDADKLAFTDMLEDLGAAVGSGNPQIASRLRDDQSALAQIQALYQREIGDIFNNLQTRGMVVHREAWEKYVAFLKQKYTREQVLREIEGQLPPAESRGAGQKKSSAEVFGNALPPKTLVLTFDDGPHPRYTDQILEILKKYNLKAVFFEVGRNLGPETTDASAKLAPTAAVSERILAQGSVLGNHSYSHPVLSKMSEAGYTKEIDTTNALLTSILKQHPVLFRPPYGAINDAIVAKVQTWPKLSYAANDAQAVRDLLVKKYSFKDDHVFLLLDQQATRQNILSLLGDKLANPDLVKREDRVFVFFAGHGATRHLASGRDLGYIIPVDADLSNYEGEAISMTNFQDIAEAIPAKHLFFVMDSCYSGLALTRGGGVPIGNYLLEISHRNARQMFTAGGADQQVADNGPNGHSVFTWTLLQALDGRADLNGDGVITATELAAYVTPAVSVLSHQTPAFGNLPGSEGGDFIFELSHETEFLNENSAQLGEDAIKVNTELEQLKDEIQKQAAQNEELKKQLAAAEAQLQQERQNAQVPGAKPALTATTTDAAAKELPAATNDEGMRLYKEKKYAEAAAKFKEASQLQPTSALFANNAGFACFKLGQYDEAVQWFLKTVSIDPNRAIAYLNLGDAYLQLGKRPEAKQAFEKYLQLQPNSKSAPSVEEKLKNL
jgi:peptidoglycan/xylan/chitin deacetylase (PgdA/CDA1 family)/Flp pilus assembly protein TadD